MNKIGFQRVGLCRRFFATVSGLFLGETFNWVLKRYQLGLSIRVLLYGEKVSSESTGSHVMIRTSPK